MRGCSYISPVTTISGIHGKEKGVRMNISARSFLIIAASFMAVTGVFSQVESFRVDMTPGDAMELYTRDVFSDSALPGPFTSHDTTWTDAEIRFKGNSTRYFAKKSYRVTFKSSNRYYGYRKINFNSMYTDKSMMREKLSWDLFAEMGALAPTAEPALLTVAGDPKGLFVQIPKVDKYLLAKNGRTEAPMYDASDLYTAADLTVQPDSLLKLYWEKEIGDETDYTDLEAMIGAINNAPDASFADTFRLYFDTTSVLRWFAGNTLTMMGDSYNKNYLLYNDTTRPTGPWTVIPWDYDLSWGRTGDLAIPYPASLLNDGFAYTFSPLSGPDNVLKTRIKADTALWDGFRNYLAGVIATTFTEAHLWPRIDSLANLIRADAAADPEKWGTMEDFEEHVEALKYYVTARRNYLLKTFVNPPSGEYNTATAAYAGENVPHHFVAFDGRLLGTLWFTGVSGLDSVTVTARPDSAPPDAGMPGDGRHIRRWVTVTPYPPEAQFTAKFRWAWSDVSTTDREVGSGVGDERLLRAYVYNSTWSTLPASVNAFANTVTIDSITNNETGPGSYFAMMLSETYTPTWTSVDNNFWERWHDVKFTDSLHGFVVGEHGSFLRTSDGGDTWERDSIGSALHFFSGEMNGGNIFAAGQGGSFYRTADTGRSWTSVGLGVTENINGVSFDGAAGVAVGDNGRAFYSGNGGGVWSEITDGIADDYSSVKYVNWIVNAFVATGDEVRVFYESSLIPGSWSLAKSLAVSHRPRTVDVADMRVWVAGDSGLVAFGDISDTAFTERNLPSSVSLHDIAALDSARVYVVGDGGAIYYTADAGLTWYRQLTGDTHDLFAIAFNGAGRGFAVGSGGTILRTDAPGTLTDIRDEGGDLAGLPSEFRLLQNYPNPFNPTTTIAFDLPSDAAVSLRIYDVLGRLVASPLNETRPAGRNTARWDASRFATGVYYYRLTASDRTGRILDTDVMKMVLVR